MTSETTTVENSIEEKSRVANLPAAILNEDDNHDSSAAIASSTP
jgi:hypothetical protein